MLFVIDDFLGSSILSEQIKTCDEFFPESMPGKNLGEVANYFHSEQVSCFSPFMFWDGWWRSPANTLKKQLIYKIWSTPNILPFNLEDIAGFEYWTRTFGIGQHLAPHVDEDTFSYEKDRTFNAPAIGCVWYGFTDNPGNGFLELHEGHINDTPKNALEKESFQNLISPLEKRERISYRQDRLVVFDAGRRVHETTATTVGERRVMVVNVWLKASPPLALQTGQFFYER